MHVVSVLDVMDVYQFSGDQTVKEIKSEDIWEFTTQNSISVYDTSHVLKTKDITATYANLAANDLQTKTLPRLVEVATNTKEAIIRYYSREIEKIQTKISEYEQKLDESPSYFKLVNKEKIRVQNIKNELGKKIAETDRNFDAYPVVELIGISLIVNPTKSEIKAKLERPGFIPKISDFSKLNQQYNTENSENTYRRLQQNPDEWVEYHKLYREARKEWKVVPYEEMIERIIEISPRLKVGDFGCGEAKIMEALGENRVFSCDHVAINDKVKSCDMKSVPLPNGSLDVVVFSLSLMGKNWVDYIVEANRCLWAGGHLLIAETTHALSEGRLSDLRQVIVNHNFEIIKEEQIDAFTFIKAKKLVNHY
jgi:hypothetical protein